MEGVLWGEPYNVPSAAYWAVLVNERREESRYEPKRVCGSFVEQVAYCLMGGYGMPAKIGNAAFHSLRTAGVLRSDVNAFEIEELLRQPLLIGATSRRYRFPKQKARYLARALSALSGLDIPIDVMSLRSLLMSIPGIGYKTASWVTRDWLGSDDVAIIDVHIERACRAIGVFLPTQTVRRDYLEMERRFLLFAKALLIRPSVLDNLMWDVMRTEGAVLGTA
jgi:N-glycosylase/DNA lyase